ncbi:hypothetical protein M115_3195 [Bacteroides fragilis str. 3719 T6]|nr:hypothetical protein M085_2874 [Bacteroides fragilis str. 3986 N(B)19]EYA47487.1 hypothetical protein M115_3195 [Bacteroides fragilis str. 3719 T6]
MFADAPHGAQVSKDIGLEGNAGGSLQANVMQGCYGEGVFSNT